MVLNRHTNQKLWTLIDPISSDALSKHRCPQSYVDQIIVTPSYPRTLIQLPIISSEG